MVISFGDGISGFFGGVESMQISGAKVCYNAHLGKVLHNKIHSINFVASC
jgi:hypothetical protein